VVFNQTLRRVARLRREALDGQPREAPGQLLGVDSVGHLDLIAGGSVRGDLTPLLRAQLLALLGDWSGAATLLEAQLPGELAGGLRQVAPTCWPSWPGAGPAWRAGQGPPRGRLGCQPGTRGDRTGRRRR
jgi:hypothetical protein